MAKEMLGAVHNKRGLVLDPRTKLVLLLVIAAFVLGGAGGDKSIYFAPVLSCVPLLLLLAARQYKGAILYVVVFGLGFISQILLLPITKGVLNFIILATSGIVSRFLPSIMMGYFVVSTTTVSEFVAAMERMHIPDKITIPLSVMFRFFPTVGEEAAAINDAMRMRGVSLAQGNIGAMLEYRLIPMMICSVKIGEELSAAALTRGLGGKVKRTNICKIGFHLQDIIAILLCIGSIGCSIWWNYSS